MKGSLTAGTTFTVTTGAIFSVIVSAICIVVGCVIAISHSCALDMYVAKLPYSVTTKAFYGELSWWCRAIYSFTPVITLFLVLIPLYLFIIALVWRRAQSHCGQSLTHQTSKFHVSNKPKLCLIAIIWWLSLALGPGVVANCWCKNHWGRARPYQVLRDQAPFTAVWQINTHAPRYNSFPSGHATIGFFLGVPLFLFGRRRAALAVGLLGGGLIGAVRILQGGHFLTDVLASGIIVLLSTTIIYCLVHKLNALFRPHYSIYTTMPIARLENDKENNCS